MSRSIRQTLVTAGSCSGLAAALFVAPVTPTAAGQPPGGGLASNCLPGVHGQTVYCDEDVNPDGSWVRCAQPRPREITVFGGAAGYIPQGPPDCKLVRPGALPVGSPPYHIGYGGEATGRV